MIKEVKATEGPWGAYLINESRYEIMGNKDSIKPLAVVFNETDAEFIANARQDVPALLAEVERLRGELETANKAAVSAVGLLGKLQRERESDFDWDIGY